MKLLFACSCLEPGRDGVGDYTRRLAQELTARGHECALLALSDSFLSEPAQSTGVLRLPATMPWTKRVELATQYRARLAPDWFSFQFVPYAYDPRGLPFGLSGYLGAIVGGTPLHIMFHEIWIGEAEGAPLKNRVVGWFQRELIRRWTRPIRQPRVIHTHTPLYQHLLRGIGTEARLLPLFGNIPNAPPNAAWLPHVFPKAAPRDQWSVFVLFGTIHPEWDGLDFQRRAAVAAQAVGRRCLFISIGRPGAAGEQTLGRLRELESDTWRNLNLGAQPESEVSQCLSAADVGVSPVPPEYVPKSGTAAAMREHGLPIVATRTMYRYRNCPPELLEVGLEHISADINLGAWPKTAPGSLLPAVADQFLHDLAQA